MEPLSGQVVDTSYRSPSGERVLRHEIMVPATIEQVWEAFTTSEGLRSFVAPFAHVELKIGGFWETSYNPEAKIGDPSNILNEIISYLPMEMISIRVAQAPPNFPVPDFGKSVWTVLQFRDQGNNRVRVITTMLGWKEGGNWDVVYQIFTQGNPHVLKSLYSLFDRQPSPA